MRHTIFYRIDSLSNRFMEVNNRVESLAQNIHNLGEQFQELRNDIKMLAENKKRSWSSDI